MSFGSHTQKGCDRVLNIDADNRKSFVVLVACVGYGIRAGCRDGLEVAIFGQERMTTYLPDHKVFRALELRDRCFVGVAHVDEMSRDMMIKT